MRKGRVLLAVLLQAVLKEMLLLLRRLHRKNSALQRLCDQSELPRQWRLSTCRQQDMRSAGATDIS